MKPGEDSHNGIKAVALLTFAVVVKRGRLATVSRRLNGRVWIVVMGKKMI